MNEITKMKEVWKVSAYVQGLKLDEKIKRNLSVSDWNITRENSIDGVKSLW